MECVLGMRKQRMEMRRKRSRRSGREKVIKVRLMREGVVREVEDWVKKTGGVKNGI